MKKIILFTNLLLLFINCFGQSDNNNNMSIGFNYSPAYNKATFTNFDYASKLILTHNMGLSIKYKTKKIIYYNYITYNHKGGVLIKQYDLSKQLTPEIKSVTQKTLHSLVTSSNLFGREFEVVNKFRMAPVLGIEVSSRINTSNEITIDRVNNSPFYSKEIIDRKSSDSNFLIGMIGGFSFSYLLSKKIQIDISPFYFKSLNSLKYNNDLYSASLNISILYTLFKNQNISQ